MKAEAKDGHARRARASARLRRARRAQSAR